MQPQYRLKAERRPEAIACIRSFGPEHDSRWRHALTGVQDLTYGCVTVPTWAHRDQPSQGRHDATIPDPLLALFLQPLPRVHRLRPEERLPRDRVVPRLLPDPCREAIQGEVLQCPA